MTDRFGGLAIPVSTSETTVGDPGLSKLGAYLQSVIVAYAGAAWAATTPPPTADELPVVKTLYLHDWDKFAFNDNALPALFVCRVRGANEQTGDVHQNDATTIRVLWAMPSSPQELQRARQPFINAIAKLVEHFVELGADPSWADPGDPDTQAASIAADVDSIALTRATSLAPVTLNSGDLDGVIGDDVMTPRRQITVTTSATPGAFNTTAPILCTVVNAFGGQVVKELFLTNANGGETVGLDADDAQAVSFVIPPQLLATGTISFGTAAFVGRGSVLKTRAGFDTLFVVDWQPVLVQHHVLDGDQLAHQRLPDHGVMISLSAREGFVPDLSTLSPNRASMTYVEDGLVVDEDELS